MSINLRLICHTCKTINTCDGLRDITTSKFHKDPPSPAILRETARILSATFSDDCFKQYGLPEILHMLADWFERHSGHITSVVNDLMMDMGDWDPYTHEETGKPWLVYQYGNEGHALVDSCLNRSRRRGKQ